MPRHLIPGAAGPRGLHLGRGGAGRGLTSPPSSHSGGGERGPEDGPRPGEAKGGCRAGGRRSEGPGPVWRYCRPPPRQVVGRRESADGAQL